MADSLVLKIKFDKTLRRITLPNLPELELSFASLDKKIRELFKLSQHASFVVTYTDNEGDIVTMADDDDMKDAITFQSLNPLRLRVKLLENAPSPQLSVVSEDQKPADAVPEQAVPIATPKVSAGTSKVLLNLEENQEALEEKLDAIFGVNVETLAASLQPSMSVVPKALDEVKEASLKPDAAAPSEPALSVAESQPKADAAESSLEKSTVPEVVDMQTEHISLPMEPVDGSTATTAVATAAEGNPAVERVQHTGFQCDMCGMIPIIGPRLKSTVKADYDLCASCYEQHGVAGEYTKIETKSRPRQFEGRMGPHGWNFGSGPRVGLGGRPVNMGRGGGCGRSFDNRCPEGKLDSRFVKDVTVFDGTEFAPGTHFTKIWRLRNTGSIPWPQHSRLVHVGGDHLGAENFVAVPVPEEGLQPGEELDASVDLLAPEKAGRYVSHWRLMAPGGRKFGHRVWALIQVVPRSEPPPEVAELVADVQVNTMSGEALSKQFENWTVLEKQTMVGYVLSEADKYGLNSSIYQQQVDQMSAAELSKQYQEWKALEKRILIGKVLTQYSEATGKSIDEIDEKTKSDLNNADVASLEKIYNDNVKNIQTVEENSAAVPSASHSPSPSEEMSSEKSVIEPETSLAAMLAPSLAGDSTVDVNSHAEEAVEIDVEEVPVHTPVIVSEYIDVDTNVPIVNMLQSPSEEKTSVGGFSFVDYPAGAVAMSGLSNASIRVQIPAEEFVSENTDPTDVEVIVFGNNVRTEENELVNLESGNVKLDEMLKQLEAMGFPDNELNAELLNQYDMDIARVLDELVAAADWAPMLNELEEMGFYDTKANRRLMFKNKGSVKRVVKELVQMYKQKGQTKA